MAALDYELFGEKSKFFFLNFPLISYDIQGNNQPILIKDFLRRFKFLGSIVSNASSYVKWTVREQDTPYNIADKLYGSTQYFWIVLMFNSMIDPVFSFPLTDNELYAYVVKKYGEDKIYNVHHYISVANSALGSLPAGIIVDGTYPTKEIVSNYEYETTINDNKREIFILKPEYIEEVLKEFTSITTEFNNENI